VSSGGRHIRFAEPSGKPPKAWFLDVASPTWEDLRAIGKVRVNLRFTMVLTSVVALTFASLTLEDILQQDPREKLDLFPRLWILSCLSFRAIETRRGSREITATVTWMGDNTSFTLVTVAVISLRPSRVSIAGKKQDNIQPRK